MEVILGQNTFQMEAMLRQNNFQMETVFYGKETVTELWNRIV
jgi:hypothetical protein